MGLEFARRTPAIERWIDGQAQVGTRALKVVRDSERAADDCAATEPSRRPRKTKSRLESLAAVNAMVERTAGASLSGNLQLAGDGIKVVLLIVLFHPRGVGLITQTEGQGEPVRHAPTILPIA